MPADYEKIRGENIARYGWDTAVLDLLGQLYSERTHFIFELIQNAEDAGATQLAFELFADRLEVTHDGRPFTEADVRGVCGVGQSGKPADLTKIGQFGIGFKSVYAYTRTPQVHSGDEHFRIENYVRPFPADPPDQPGPGTLFVFPFDHDTVPAAAATAEISAALNALPPTTLLFLRNIRSVRTGGAGVAGSVLDRVVAGRTPSSRHVTLATGRGHAPDEWLVWHRPLGQLGHPAQRVEIAFRVDARSAARPIVSCPDSPLVVFFPTQKETFLGFLVQGPYRTTPARDNVPGDDPSNQALVRETAALLTEVLRELRDDGLLTAGVLETLPLDTGRFPPGTMFRPLFDAVRTAMAGEELVPAAGGGYGSARQLLLTSSTELRTLFRPDQLGRLYQAGRPLAFTGELISEHRTPRLWQYLREEIGAGEVTPQDAVARVTGDFLEAQPDEWITRFYAFLHTDPALWRAPGSADDRPGPARARPIIRLEDGRQVEPFDAAGRPAAYLPGAHLPGPAGTGFPTVRRAVAAAPAARQFLEALQFTEPDVVDEVLEIILPRYRGLEAADLDPGQRDADLECVVRALDEAAAGPRQRLLEQLQHTAFLIGENAATGEQRLMPPSALYQRSKQLEIYLDGNPDAWFADDGYGPWLVQLRGMGVRDRVELRSRAADSLGYVVIADGFARHERGLDGFDPDADIDGLDFALRQPTHDRSEYIWNALLTAHRHLVTGVVETSVRDGFIDSSRESVSSAMGRAAAGAAWLPGPDGRFHRPAELALDDLPPAYKRDESLAAALGMTQPVVAEASRQLGLPPDLLWGLSAHPDLVATIERELKARSAASRKPEPDGPRPAL